MSRLFERMAVACARLLAKTEPDGEGGFKTVLAVSDGFTAAIVRDSSTASRIAEHDGVRNVYTVTTAEPLRYGDLFQRAFDGHKVLSVNSELKHFLDNCNYFLSTSCLPSMRISII